MPFQAPHYNYPQQTVYEDPVGSVARGAATALELYAKFQQAKDLNRKDQLNQNISKIYDKTQGEIGQLNKPTEPGAVAAPNQDDTIKRMMGAENTAQNQSTPGLATYYNNQQQGTTTPQIEANPMLGTAVPAEGKPVSLPEAQAEKMIADHDAAQVKYEKDAADYQHKVISLNAKMSNDIINAHYKHGFTKEAQELEGRFMEHAMAAAKIDPSLGEKVWNNSSLADKYGQVKIRAKNDEWSLSKDGLRAINKNTGETREIPMTITDAVKMMKNIPEGAEGWVPVIGGQGNIEGFQFKKNPKDTARQELREEKRDERDRKKEEDQRIKQNLDTNKQYWKDLKTTAEAFIKDNQSSVEPDVILKVEKYKAVLQKLPDYERFDRDYILKGKDPVHPEKIMGFLEGSATPQKTNSGTKKLTYNPATRKFE